jgi:undecaprenyl-diphosphatase
MKKKMLFISIGLLAAFIIWTALVSLVDVRVIGPESSSVGFATLNKPVHEIIGVNWFLYSLTDWLSLIPFSVALGFAILGFVQLIKRRSLRYIDQNILMLGGLYLVVIAVFIFFECVVINYRPTMINGQLEASYPSSTTLLVTCVMPTAAIELNRRIKNATLKLCTVSLIIAFTVFMLIARIISGVHWITDIIGGGLLSAGLVLLFSLLTKTNHIQ